MVNLTYSEIVYLFGDKFVSERGGLVSYDSHPSGVKIPVGKLAQVMVTAAVVYLSEKGLVELSVKEAKKLFVFSGKDIFVKKIKDGGSEVTGIESGLLNYIKEETKLSKAVYWLLSDDESSPWGQIIYLSKNSLAQKKVLQLEEKAKGIFSTVKYLYDPKVLSQYNVDFEKVQKALAEFFKQTEVSKLVFSAVKSGMAARRAQSSSDD